MFSQSDVNNLLQIIQTGRQNAITAFDIAQRLGYQTGGNQVETRELIKYAISQGNIILSSPGNPSGYWLSNDLQEVKDSIESLEHRANEINERADNLRNSWNSLNPNNQI